MATIRVNHKSSFTVISNALINDSRLDYKDVGLLVYLLSKPDNWEVSTAHLQTIKKSGRDAIHASLNAIIKAGYATRKTNPRGGWDYEIFEQSNTENPNTENPNTENPNTENPNTEKRPQVNTDNKQILKKKVNTEKATTATREQKKTEIEKPAVAAKNKNEYSLPRFKKPNGSEIEKTQEWLDSHIDSTPFVAPINPNDIALTPEQLACYQWAMTDLAFWRAKINSKAKFISLYEKQDSALKHQYETDLLKQQAQKSPAIATYDQQGLQIIPFNSGQNYDTSRRNHQQPVAGANRQVEAGREACLRKFNETGHIEPWD